MYWRYPEKDEALWVAAQRNEQRAGWAEAAAELLVTDDLPGISTSQIIAHINDG